MLTILILIAVIALAHHCRQRGDNLTAIGFLLAGVLLVAPGFLAYLFDQLTVLFEDNTELLGTLVSWAVVIGAGVIGLRYIFGAGRR